MGNEVNWSELLKTLGPAIVTGLTAIFTVIVTATITYLASRHQFKMKLIEIKGQSELRARELLFDAYQKRLERILNELNEFDKSISLSIGELKGMEDHKDVDNKYFPQLLKLFKGFLNDFEEEIAELEDELNKENLLNKRNMERLTFMRNVFSEVVNEDVKNEDSEKKTFQVIRAARMFSRLIDELLEKKSTELFSVYLKS